MFNERDLVMLISVCVNEMIEQSRISEPQKIVTQRTFNQAETENNI